MKLIADLHTHSNHSRFHHGKSSVMQMIMRANELGLKELAITDHSFRHFFHTTKDKLYDARLTIDDMNKWSKTKVLLGIEANILNEAGDIDVDAETMALIEILVVGYHRCIKTDFAGFFGSQKKIPDAKQKATNAFLNAIAKYPITILSHINAHLDLDLYQIGKACAEKGVMVEINNRHSEWTQEQMDDLLASGCTFIVCSDAHCAEDIGRVQNCFDVILRYNIPSERIAAVEFDDSEMTDEHREINILYDDFMRKQGKVEQQEKERFEQAQNRSNLSSEMEEELQKIAQEKGYLYTKPKPNEVYTESGNVEIVDANNQNSNEFQAENQLDQVQEEVVQTNPLEEVAEIFRNAEQNQNVDSEEDIGDNENIDDEEQENGENSKFEDSFDEKIIVGEEIMSEDEEPIEDMIERNAKVTDVTNVSGKQSKFLNETNTYEIATSDRDPIVVAVGEKEEKNNLSRDERTQKVQGETLKRGGAVVVKNERKVKREDEIKPDDMINLFSVNVSQHESKASAEEIRQERQVQAQEETVKPKNITRGAFYDVTSLAEAEQDKGSKKKTTKKEDK